MDGGRIVAEGTPSALIAEWSTREVVELRFGSGQNEAAANRLATFAERVEVLPDRVLLYAEDGDAVMHEVHEAGFRPESALARRSSLEDVFLRLTGRSLVE